MRLRVRPFSFLRWCCTAAALVVVAGAGLSMRYNFGVIRTVPHPNGNDAPVHTTIMMFNGGFLYVVGQGMTGLAPDSPYAVLGTHWRWDKLPSDQGRLWWRARNHAMLHGNCQRGIWSGLWEW